MTFSWLVVGQLDVREAVKVAETDTEAVVVVDTPQQGNL